MPIVSKRELFNFYGAAEAGEFLWQTLKAEYISSTARKYLEWAATLTVGQFDASLTFGLQDKRIQRGIINNLNKDKHNIESREYKVLLDVVTRKQSWEVLNTLPLDLILGLYDLTTSYYIKKEGEYKLYETNTRYLGKAYERLRESLRTGSLNDMITAVDYINNLTHSQGQLLTWIDEEEWVKEAGEPFALWAYTIISASIYQPEALSNMDRVIRKALRERARLTRTKDFDPYDRQQFLRNFVSVLQHYKLYTADGIVEEINYNSPWLLKELKSVKGFSEFEDQLKEDLQLCNLTLKRGDLK